MLRLWWTNLDGTPAAIEYTLQSSDTVYFYQSGIEPELSNEHPGWLSTICSFRSAIEQGVRYFDFMRGDEAYKASWGATVRPSTELRIVAPRIAPRLRYSAFHIKKQLGRFKRAIKNRFRSSKRLEKSAHQNRTKAAEAELVGSSGEA
jgi:CelD/BcsL family acetyltransferase involved in cellulose biosynthesis